MAIFRPGHVVGAISGNLQGSNFVLGRYGPYVRKRLVRTKKATEDQLARRAYLQRLILHWQGLSGAQRNAWNAAAKLVQFTNRLGIPRHITGHQLFVRDNIRNINDVTPFNNPPRNLFRPTAPTELTIIASAAGNVSITWTMLTPPNTARAYVYGCRPMSSSPSTYLNNFKHFTDYACSIGFRNNNVTADWDSEFGHPVENEKIGILLAVNSVNYLSPIKYPASTIVVA